MKEIWLFMFLQIQQREEATPSQCLNQHQEELINRQDNLPLIEEAREREPCGSRIIRF
jgi:hypothetical protein